MRTYSWRYKLAVRHYNPQDFLIEASEILGESLDYATTLERISQLTVRDFATWCALDVVNDAGAVDRLLVAHRDPSKKSLTEAIRTRYPASARAARGVYRVLRTGEPVLIPECPDSSWELRADDAEHLRIIRELGSRSYMCVPLKARGRIVGTILFFSAERTYGHFDLEIATELARRFGLAVDNAQMFTRMQESIRLREEFLSIAAHEIRTPLTPLLFQSRALRKTLDKTAGLSPADQLVAAQTAREAEAQVDRLCKIVHELMDASLLSARRMDLSPSEASLLEICEGALRTLTAHHGELTSTVSIEARDPCRGRWDRLKIERAVTNLISNALKYGRGSPIRLLLAREGEHAVLRLTDHGPGIAPEDLELLFRPFFRARAKARQEGTGLGLYICRQIIALHGGTIHAESRPGEGATFVLTLPAEAPVLPGLARSEVTELEIAQGR